MEKAQFSIQIPKPCHEDWDKMLPNNHGKLCCVCDKTVVDFTKMNDEDLKSFFTSKKNEKVCGYFNANQITEYVPLIHRFLIHFYRLIEKNVALFFIKQPSLLVLGGMMFLVGCDFGKKKGEADMMISKDSTSNEQTTPEVKKDTVFNSLGMPSVPANEKLVKKGLVATQKVCEDTASGIEKHSQRDDFLIGEGIIVDSLNIK